MDRLDSEVGGNPPRPDSATGAETQDHYWAEFEGATPQPEASNLKEGPDHFWAEFEGADQQLDSGNKEASLDHNGEDLEEESPRPAPVRNDALSKSLAEEKRSASRRFTWVWMMLAPYLLVLPFAPIIELFPDKESTESRCYGNGQTSYHLLGECWDRLDGDYIGEVGNYSLDGTNYTVHAWEVPTEDRDQQWISDAVYVRLDVWAGFGWAEYYTYFECQGLYNCHTNVDHDNKTWTAVEARKWLDRDDSPQSTTMFVNIEEGGPVLIAIDSSIPLNSAPTVDIELIH